MPLDLSSLDSKINDNLTTPAAAPTTTVTVEVPPAPDNSAELSAMRAELDALKAERDAQNEAAAVSRLELATAQAKRTPVSLNTAQQDLKLHKAIKEVGGPAFWYSLTSEQKAVALGIVGVEQTKDSEIKRYFGASSDSMTANALAKSDPARYSRLRQIAKLRGIL